MIRSASLICLTLSFYGMVLSLVFFTVGASAMARMTEQQAQSLVQRNFSPVLALLSIFGGGGYTGVPEKDVFLNNVTTFVNTKKKNMKNDKSITKKEKNRIENNKKIVEKATKSFLVIWSVLFLIGVVLWYVSRYTSSFSFFDVLAEALLMSLLVGTLQIVYTKIIITNLYPLDNNAFLKNVLGNLTSST